MSDDVQSPERYSEFGNDPLDDDIAADPQADGPSSQTVFHQVQLDGPMGTMYVHNHLLNAEQGKANYLIGSEQDDEVHGGALDDIILGKGGNDELYGHGGNDLLLGDEGRDDLLGGDGDDTLDSGDGNDSLQGERGNDILMGGADHDIVLGGEGADIIIGGTGNDSLSGQEGDDIYHFDKGDGEDVIWNADESVSPSTGHIYQDRIEYGSGIASEQLWFQCIGSDLLVTNLETGDSQRVKQWYEGRKYRIDEFCLDDGKRLTGERVDSLVEAMASMAMPTIGSTHLPPAYQATLNPILTQNWQ